MIIRREVRTNAFYLGIACLALLGGCSFAPKYTRPGSEAPFGFKELTPGQAVQLEGWKMAEPNDKAWRGNWWEMFGDTNLNALEAQASVSNQTVAAVFGNLLAARALVKQARSQLFPTISANPSVTRSRESTVRSSSVASASSSSIVTEYSLLAEASWEPDLWGSIRNTVKANALGAQASLADLGNTQLATQAELAADYFQIRILDSEKQLLDSAVQAYAESLRLTQVRHETGIASDQDVAQAETQLDTTRAQATDLGIQRAQLEHAIAVLIGKPASLFSMATNDTTPRPVVVPFGVPSQLLERRPDIAAAERRAAAANAQIGVARAAYFPTITLSGSAGYGGTSVGSLFSGPALVWSVGAAMAQTLFDAGRRQGVTEQAWAVYETAIANYRQTVLSAFQEVEDNLSALRIIAQELHEQDAAVDSSQRYLTLAEDRYKLGIDSYLNVIIAQTALLNNMRIALTLRMEQMTSSVQLIKALGGDWDARNADHARM
jgi:NodT family efflux transporter outer membrane factor (OMF) lipoprotein